MAGPVLFKNGMTVSEAASFFGISNSASIHEIREKYHTLIKEWHPDVSAHQLEKSHTMMIQIKEAYELLIEYCMNYQISFRPEDCNKATLKGSMEYWYERFGDDPIWG